MITGSTVSSTSSQSSRRKLGLSTPEPSARHQRPAPEPGSRPERRIYAPARFDDRPRAAQIVIAGLVPIALGAVAGILIGASAAAYWALALVAGVGAFLSGFEHWGGWEAADRGFFGGVFYGAALLIVHHLVGTEAKVSLGSFPPLLVLITAIAGMLLAAAGGWLGRVLRERAGLQSPAEPDRG